MRVFVACYPIVFCSFLRVNEYAYHHLHSLPLLLTILFDQLGHSSRLVVLGLRAIWARLLSCVVRKDERESSRGDSRRPIKQECNSEKGRQRDGKGTVRAVPTYPNLLLSDEDTYNDQSEVDLLPPNTSHRSAVAKKEKEYNSKAFAGTTDEYE